MINMSCEKIKIKPADKVVYFAGPVIPPCPNTPNQECVL